MLCLVFHSDPCRTWIEAAVILGRSRWSLRRKTKEKERLPSSLSAGKWRQLQKDLPGGCLSKKDRFGVPVVAQQLTNLTRIPEDRGSIPGLAQWVKDLVLLWLWCRLVATAPIRPLAWEPPYTMGSALKRQKKKKKKKTDCSHTFRMDIFYLSVQFFPS